MKIKMRKERVLLRQSVENLTNSGLQLSADAKARDLREVVAVGEGVEDIKPGDQVLVNHITVKEIELQGDTFGVCLSEAVYGIVGEGEEIPEQKQPEAPKQNPIIMPENPGIIK